MSRKIIDAHIHPFIDPENNIAFFGAPKTGEEYMNELKSLHFDQVCGSVVVRKKMESMDEVRNINRIALKIKDMYPGFYEPGIHVYDADPEGSCRELEEMRKVHDVRWIGELVHYMMGTGLYNSSGMFQIYETARDLKMPVNIHCDDLDVVADILKNFPDLNVILAHPGDCGNALKRLEFISQYKNAYMDISGTGLFRWNMLRYAVDLCGSEKLLFGTDFPICSPGMNLGGVLSEHLTEEEFDNVLGLNFLRLTGRI